MKKKIIIICVMLLTVTGCSLFKTKEDLSKYIGVWGINDSEIPDEEISISKINDDEIVFNYYLYRLATFESINAKLDGTNATFEAKNDLGWEIRGTIELNNNIVTLYKTAQKI